MFRQRKVALWIAAGGVSVLAHAGGFIALMGVPSERGGAPLVDSPAVDTELFITQAPQDETAPAASIEVEPAPEPAISDANDEVAPSTVENEFAPVVVERFDPPSTAPKIPSAAPERKSVVLTPPTPTQTSPPSASFAGVKGERAGRVVYVLDASGAMTSCLPFIKKELEASVSRLIPGQTFQIVMMRRRATEKGAEIRFFNASGDGFLAPDTKNRVTLKDWLDDVSPKWASDPGAGIEAALKQQPDVIFVLTRSIRRSAGDEPLNRSLLARLDSLNPKDRAGRRRTAIKVLQFIDEDPTGVLPEIAREHGDGPESYRVIKPTGR